MKGETWLVLGATSTIARAFAREVAEAGADVLLAGRDLDDLRASAADIAIRTARRAEAVAFDATSYASHAPLIAQAKQFAGAGALNLFVGFGTMPGQVEIDGDFALAEQTIAVNYTAVASILHAAAPVLKAQGKGHVVVIGSVAGDRGRPKNYTYGSAKAGVHALLSGYRAVMFRHGVSVTTVKPGFVDTAMTWGLPGVAMAAPPEAVARAAAIAALRGRDVIYTPWFWRGIMTIVRSIPERVFKRLDI